MEGALVHAYTRANEDRNEVEDSFLEDFPNMQACTDAKTNAEDDCSAKRRSVAVELEVNHFAVHHLDDLSCRTFLIN